MSEDEFLSIQVLDRPESRCIAEFLYQEGTKIGNAYGLSPVVVITSFQDYADLANVLGPKIDPVSINGIGTLAIRMGNVLVIGDSHVNYLKVYIPKVEMKWDVEKWETK